MFSTMFNNVLFSSQSGPLQPDEWCTNPGHAVQCVQNPGGSSGLLFPVRTPSLTILHVPSPSLSLCKSPTKHHDAEKVCQSGVRLVFETFLKLAKRLSTHPSLFCVLHFNYYLINRFLFSFPSSSLLSHPLLLSAQLHVQLCDLRLMLQHLWIHHHHHLEHR